VGVHGNSRGARVSKPRVITAPGLATGTPMRHRPLVHCRAVLAGALLLAALPATAATPSFDCSRKINAAQELICADDTLAGLDRKLGDVFARAARSLPNDKTIAYLVAEEQQWTNSRDGCPATPDPHACLSSVYRTRIAELEGRYRMVPVRGPFRFTCDSTPPQDIVVTWYETDPPSGLLETKAGTTPLFQTASASGARYVGDDVQYWEHQGTATLTFALQSQELNCTPKR
jgi:uncharacterized protein